MDFDDCSNCINANTLLVNADLTSSLALIFISETQIPYCHHAVAWNGGSNTPNCISDLNNLPSLHLYLRYIDISMDIQKYYLQFFQNPSCFLFFIPDLVIIYR